MYPFLQKIRNKFFVKLHKELYNIDFIRGVEKNEPGFIRSILSGKNYYLVELGIREESEYFIFLNCLINLNQER
jgi:hypothetical protein